MTVAALVLGAGSGERLRASLGTGAPEREEKQPALPKAFVALCGRSLLARSIAALSAASEIDRVVPVLPADALDRWPAVATELDAPAKVAPPVVGGSERQDSVRRGLAVLGPEVSHVAVHDAARPLVQPGDVSRVVQAGLAHGAAILAVPAGDSIKRVVAGRVIGSPPRRECWAAQTPQVFRVEWLREALEKAAADGFLGTDDAELVARLGVVVHVVEGDPRNLKITRAADLEAARSQLRGEARGHP